MFHLNESIHQNTHGERYVTLFLGLLDVRNRGLHYINAGHVPPMLVRSHDQCALDAGGTVVGLFPQQRYRRGFARLEPGDVVVACTDGITETSGPDDEEYGMARLVDSVRAHRRLPATELVDALLGDVTAFAVDGVLRDDRVLMVVKAGH
jgi:sigma-B regulation protein RsbU (phosphoserine phosphatase)